MAFTMTLWGVHNEALALLPKHKLDNEDRLETWIAQDPSLLGMNILVIGRQVVTDFGKKIDLLAIDEEGDLVVIELKRDKTPRDVVAQVLDYASWVNGLAAEDIIAKASDYLKKPLAHAFKDRFDAPLPESLNKSHRLLIVASELDDSSERIVQYLSSVCSLDINVVFFTCFQHNGVELVGRSWLMDPEEVEERSTTRQMSVKPLKMTWGQGNQQETVSVNTWKEFLKECVGRAVQAGLPIGKLPMKKRTSDGTFNDLAEDDPALFFEDHGLHVLCHGSAVRLKKWIAAIRKELGKPEGFITVETVDGQKTDL